MKSTNNVSGFILFTTLLLSTSFNAYSYDYLGSDILGGSVLVANPDQCAAACNGNPICVAWTFVRPPLKHPTSPVCFLKKAVPEPSLKGVCTSNSVCLSGIKRTDGWCGETPLQNVGGSGVQGQGQVLSCPSGLTCKSTLPPLRPKPWYCFFLPLDECKQVKTQSADYFCQP